MKYIKTFCLSLLLITAACAKQEFKLSNAPASSIAAYEKDQTFFIYGIGQEEDVQTADICGGNHNVAKVANRLSEIDVIVGLAQSAIFLPQIYSPREASVYCKQ